MAKTAAGKRTIGQEKKRNPQTAVVGSKNRAKDAAQEKHAHRWTFLSNHAHVLIVLFAQPGIVLRSVAARVGITERAVQRIIHDLEEQGCIRREKVGRQNRYEVLADQPLRHPIEAHRKIGDLLAIFED
jgi:hypothetical protein